MQLPGSSQRPCWYGSDYTVATKSSLESLSPRATWHQYKSFITKLNWPLTSAQQSYSISLVNLCFNTLQNVFTFFKSLILLFPPFSLWVDDLISQSRYQMGILPTFFCYETYKSATFSLTYCVLLKQEVVAPPVLSIYYFTQ